MNKQNGMMNFVWLLNAAANSAFEVNSLCREFLQSQKEFSEMRSSLSANTDASIDANAARSNYLEGEIRRSLESLNNLNKTVQEVIDVLSLPGAGDANDA